VTDAGGDARWVLTAAAGIALHMAIKSERGGDSAAALKRLQDHLALVFADMAAYDPTGGRATH
jgi:hypothetical protein